MCSFSRFPIISKCCCFISLRYSGYFIGLLQFLLGLGGLSFITYDILNQSVEVKNGDHDGNSTDTENDENDEFSTDSYNIVIAVSFAFILLGALLVLGVKIKNVLLIKVYIISKIIFLLIGFIFYIIVILYLILAFVIASSDTTNFFGEFLKLLAAVAAQALVVVIVVTFVVLVIMIYFLICVNSYLEELNKLKIGGTPQAVAYTAVADTDDKVTKI